MENIKSIMTNILFRIWLAVFSFSVYYFDIWKVFSFSNSFNTQQQINYWKQESVANYVDSTVISVSIQQMALWNEKVSADWTYWSMLDTIQTMEDLIKTDVLQLIQWATKKNEVLNDFIGRTSQILDIALDQKWLLEQNNQEYLTLQTSCESQKAVADSQFTLWIQQFDGQQLEDWLNDSVDNWVCAIKNRILYRAGLIILKRIEFLRLILLEKYDLLLQNETQITTHSELLQDQVLENLLQIRNKLSTYKVE